MTSSSTSLAPAGAFTPEQKEYLAGFMAGAHAGGVFVGLNGHGRFTVDAGSSSPNLAAPAAEEALHGTPLAELCKEERWKHDENPLDAWERLLAHADADQFPDAEHTYRFKFFGLFYVAPAQDSFMVRVRIPAGELTSAQLHGLADLAADLGGGYADLTTRAALQIRECRPRSIIKVLTRLQELGLTARGSGSDNIRNITVTPTSGLDTTELLDVRPFAHGLHHYILNHRDLYGLPRKFNVAFDSGGAISAAADTNDIGFMAVRVTEKSLAAAAQAERATEAEGRHQPNPKAKIDPGIYFRVHLGGITGHGDFARDTGLLITPDQSVAVAAAMIRVFVENGDRTNRKKARLKYLLEKWGVEKFLEETQKKLAFPLARLPLAASEPRRPVEKHGWLGARRQTQRGLNYVGVGVPAGRLTVRQLRRVAELAANYGQGQVRLTAWQTLLIPHVPDAFVATLARNLTRAGLFTESGAATGGIIACTGSKGCKYAAADTKGHALATARHLTALGPLVEQRDTRPLPGGAHTGAPHYCGDVGFIGAKQPDGTDGYHIVLGGGMDQEQGIAREVFRGVRATEVPALTEKILRTYAARRAIGESFVQWSRRHTVKELQEALSA